MSDTTEQKDILRGGQFLVKETNCEDVFTPEDFSEEQQMMKEAVMEFNDREIIAHKARFEAKDYALTEEEMGVKCVKLTTKKALKTIWNSYTEKITQKCKMS